MHRPKGAFQWLVLIVSVNALPASVFGSEQIRVDMGWCVNFRSFRLPFRQMTRHGFDCLRESLHEFARLFPDFIFSPPGFKKKIVRPACFQASTSRGFLPIRISAAAIIQRCDYQPIFDRGH
jgi:hypothetical protein